MPTIRKTGSYNSAVPQTYAQALLEAGRLALELEKKEAIIQEVKEQRNQAINTVNKQGDILLYQARALAAREEAQLNQDYYPRRNKR